MMVSMMGTPMSAPGMPHRKPKKNTAKTTTKWRDGERGTGGERLDVVADEELDGRQSDEDEDDRLPGVQLTDGEEGRKKSCHEGADEGDVVEGEGKEAPGGGGFEAGEQGKAPDRDAGENAEQRAHQHVAAELGRNLGDGPDELGARSLLIREASFCRNCSTSRSAIIKKTKTRMAKPASRFRRLAIS